MRTASVGLEEVVLLFIWNLGTPKFIYEFIKQLNSYMKKSYEFLGYMNSYMNSYIWIHIRGVTWDSSRTVVVIKLRWTSALHMNSFMTILHDYMNSLSTLSLVINIVNSGVFASLKTNYCSNFAHLKTNRASRRDSTRKKGKEPSTPRNPQESVQAREKVQRQHLLLLCKMLQKACMTMLWQNLMPLVLIARKKLKRRKRAWGPSQTKMALGPVNM